jgi:hypothetical protein
VRKLNHYGIKGKTNTWIKKFLDDCKQTVLDQANYKEEDMLVHLRHEQQDLFSKTRNHNRLWHNIAQELCKTFQTKISGIQALNKYNNLKKRWKEIVDAGTGTERKDFRLSEEFDLVFGTKPSTRPFATLDSVSSNSPSSPKSLRNTTNSSSQLVPRESRKVPKKGSYRVLNYWKI